MRQTVILLVSLVLVLAACNVFIEKRRYNKGFHVQWNNKKRVTKSDEKEEIRSANNQSLRLDEVEKTDVNNTVSNDALVQQESMYDSKYTDQKVTVSKENLSASKEAARSDQAQHRTIDQKIKHVSVSELSRKGNSDRQQNDFWLYGLLAGVFATTYSLVRIFRKRSMRISRWASRNKKVTRGAIFAGHVGLGALGFYIGNSFGQMGNEFTLGSQYALGGTFFLGSAFLYHLEKKGVGFATWKSFFSHRLGHLVAGVSLFGLMMGAGNAFQFGNEQISVVGNAITYISGDHDTADAAQTEGNEEQKSKPSAGAVVLAILVAIVILGLTAAGACAAACNDQGFLAVAIVILGLGLTVLAITAITRNR